LRHRPLRNGPAPLHRPPHRIRTPSQEVLTALLITPSRFEPDDRN
jgi:hypothetical protein